MLSIFTNASEREIVDDWGQVIKGGQSFLEAIYLLKSSETTLTKKLVGFYHCIVVL